MIRSMTAFARHEQTTHWGAVTWELRSVNHRYLETTLRLPESVRMLEPAVRERIAALLSRGKVDAQLRLSTASGALAKLSFNRPVAEQVLNMAAELEQMMGPGMGLQPIDVLRWPGVVSEPELDQDAVQKAVLTTLETALADLLATREREGERIKDMLRSRCLQMGEQIKIVRERRPQVLSRQREKLLSRLADLPVDADRNRLEQELVLFAQRLDVEEELDRLEAHLSEINAVFKRPEPVGRRLDFLMQELNREANTLSSKSGDADTTRAAVELKVLIEQMREQVQNVE